MVILCLGFIVIRDPKTSLVSPYGYVFHFDEVSGYWL